MKSGWILVIVSLIVAALVCTLPSICTACPVREGMDGSGGSPSVVVETPSTSAAPASQPPTGTAQQNASAIKALRDQIAGISGLAQQIAVLQRKVQGNETALVGKDGNGGLQKVVNQCQAHCSSTS